ncbi:hypothetical protein MLD38_002087 [Melastoma candidum]|uniref:Uncharacterized protein n=1 Tax=Melastoma candidum TaxID=119954 RepID=A0ACB9SFF1_9MYRT|nr:hypothetical protein MLD38_002087 [Melastoma candidum]
MADDCRLSLTCFLFHMPMEGRRRIRNTFTKSFVRPVISRYPYQRFSPAWESISGAPHVIYLLCQFVMHFPVHCPSQEEKDDAKLCCNRVRRLMAMEVTVLLGKTLYLVYYC